MTTAPLRWFAGLTGIADGARFSGRQHRKNVLAITQASILRDPNSGSIKARGAPS